MTKNLVCIRQCWLFYLFHLIKGGGTFKDIFYMSLAHWVELKCNKKECLNNVMSHWHICSAIISPYVLNLKILRAVMWILCAPWITAFTTKIAPRCCPVFPSPGAPFWQMYELNLLGLQWNTMEITELSKLWQWSARNLQVLIVLHCFFRPSQFLRATLPLRIFSLKHWGESL